MQMAMASCVAEIPSAAQRQEQDDLVALSEVLLTVQSLIMQHEPRSATCLLMKVAEFVQKQGFMIAAADWFQAVKVANTTMRVTRSCLAAVQDSLEKDQASGVGQAKQPAPSRSGKGLTPQYTARSEAQTELPGLPLGPLRGHRPAVSPINAPSVDAARPPWRRALTSRTWNHATGSRVTSTSNAQSTPQSCPATMDQLTVPPCSSHGSRSPSCFASAAAKRLNVSELRDSFDDLPNATLGTFVKGPLKGTEEPPEDSSTFPNV
eukprot:TRINITY_DN123880_c0_g1_i1.p1 TRINITY_DN123880_c0_g1~~TRINITY_DN123880_c0_g1_i1.p1  ORF type:complete len:264 (-),score=33.68 TRINITY_DN123880_c0_g1_i1:392-1183(-)